MTEAQTDPVQDAVAAYQQVEQQLAWWAVATARYFGDEDNDEEPS